MKMLKMALISWISFLPFFWISWLSFWTNSDWNSNNQHVEYHDKFVCFCRFYRRKIPDSKGQPVLKSFEKTSSSTFLLISFHVSFFQTTFYRPKSMTMKNHRVKLEPIPLHHIFRKSLLASDLVDCFQHGVAIVSV